MSITKEILTRYLDAQKDLIAIESVDDRSAILSLPLHFSAYSRVELSVTQVTKSQFVVSDMGQTIGEMKDAGYQVKDKVRQRIVELVKIAQLQLDGNTLLRQCSADQLGKVIHDFADAAKTVGDAYLAYPSRGGSVSKVEDDLKKQIRSTFNQKHYLYKETQTLPGEIEEHTLDFVINPNGAKGLALGVLPNADRVHAEAWAFKTHDIKRGTNDRFVVGIVYNAAKVVEISKHILDKMADLSIPSSAFALFGERLDALNISRGY